MKKITLVSFMFAVTVSFAQQAQQGLNVGSLKNGLLPIENKAASLNATERNKQSLLQGAGFHYLLLWEDAKEQYEIAVNNTPASNYVWYVNPVFMDSTARYSSSSSTRQMSDMRVGMIIDPKSPYYDPNQGDVPLLTATDAYQVDTVLVNVFYQRRLSVNDTLNVELSWGDTTLNTVWTNGLTNSTKKQRWICPNISSSKTHGNTSHLSAPTANKLRINRVLTDADTVTVNNPWAGWIVVVVPNGGLKLPAKSVVAVTCTFVPGSGYTNGDVVFEYANALSPATRNGLAVALRGQKDFDPSANGGLGNGQSYWYDRSTIGSNTFKTKNSSVGYDHLARYGKYTGGLAYANTLMYPSTDFCWNIGMMISNQPVGIKEENANNLHIGQNVPNPFSNITFISYELSENTNVLLEVFDITGKKVQSIEEGKKFAGSHSVQFNGSNLQAGVYFYTITAGENRVTKRMTLVR